MIPTHASVAPHTQLDAAIKEKIVSHGLVTRKRGLLLGLIFALCLAVSEVYFPALWMQNLTAFLAVELLMWTRISEPESGLSMLSHFLLPNELTSSSEQSPLTVSLKQAISVGKACFHAGQDWLIAQFFVVLLHNIPRLI